jgi:hypothetical protein
MGKRTFQHSDQHPLSYWRYVDDVWGLWIHGENSLHNFVSVANSIHPRIKLELRYSTDSIEFLDVRASLVNGISSAFRQASVASSRGTLGYNALTSRQSMMVLYGNGCGIEFNLLRKSVDSFMKLGKLLTFSLSSFSTPREEAKRACRKALNKRTNHNLPTDYALQLIDIVLENNLFSFKFASNIIQQ